LLFFAWLVLGIAIIVRNKIKKQTVKISKLLFIPLLAVIILFGWFGKEHLKTHPKWINLFQDISVAIQVEKYQNWKSPHIFGYPLNQSGSTVDRSAYVRVAWATAGITILMPKNPLGLGILNGPFSASIKQMYGIELPPNLSSTHSAWIEFGLAFGYPGALLLLSTLLILIARSLSKRFIFSATSFSISLSLLIMYTVGELSTAHAVEILFYWIGLLFAMQITQISTLKTNSSCC
jgi:hypothetical protein